MGAIGIEIFKDGDDVDKTFARISALLKHEILVGVTTETANKGVSAGQINNAAKAAINDLGAP